MCTPSLRADAFDRRPASVEVPHTSAPDAFEIGMLGLVLNSMMCLTAMNMLRASDSGVVADYCVGARVIAFEPGCVGSRAGVLAYVRVDAVDQRDAHTGKCNCHSNSQSIAEPDGPHNVQSDRYTRVVTC
jgi:hypothetical protein